MHVSVRNLTQRFGATVVLKDVSLEIADHELFFLLGPSGCGKTTLLRLIAGFYRPDAGEIYFGERSLRDVPPHQRNTGMVFQNYALWPHLTVAQNVAYGLEVRGIGAAERARRAQEALEIVQMPGYAQHTPNQLSGGQQQRVALARALVVRPDVLLLDEPLSNLDARLRLEMRDEIRRIHDQTRITTIYVTHDQKESLSLADRMAVLHAGAIQQIGTPRDVYCAPANRFVADFIGETNWLSAEVTAVSESQTELRTGFGAFVALPQPGLAVGDPVWLGFRPEAVQLEGAAANSLATTIAQVTYLGEIEQYVLTVSPSVTIKAFEQNPPAIRRVGSPLAVHVRPANLFVLPRTDA